MSDTAPPPTTAIGVMFAALLAAVGLSACAGGNDTAAFAPLSPGIEADTGKEYLIGAGDQLEILVWGNPELSSVIRVRPDGRISAPLIDDVPVSGRTPSQVARTLEEKFAVYVVGAKVAIVMVDALGPMARQVRVIGQAAKPQALGYRQGMTVLDVMIAAGGLTPFAAGNRATISRTANGQPTIYRLRLADLLQEGDTTANVEVAPGDVITVPQSWF